MNQKIDVVYDIIARTDRLEVGLSKAREEFQKTEEEAKGLRGILEKIRSSKIFMAGQILSIASTIAIALKGITGAVESLKNILRLEASIKNLGLSAEDSAKALQDFISEAQKLTKLTGVDDDIILRLYQLGTQAGLAVDQTKELAKLAMNISQAFGMDLETAMLQVIRLFQGGETYLTRYDARLKALIQSGASNAEIAKYMTETYGGFLDKVKEVNVVEKFQTTISNFFEDVGKIFLPYVIRAFERFQQAIQNSTGLVYFLGKGLEFVFGILEVLFGLANKLITALNPVLKWVADFKAYIQGILMDILGLVGLVEKTGQARIDSLQKKLNVAERELEMWVGRLGSLDILVRKGVRIPVELLKRGDERSILQFFSELARYGVPTEKIDYLRKAVVEYRAIQEELKEAKQTKEETIKVDEKTLGTIKKVKEEVVVQKKEEKSVYDTLVAQLVFVEKLVSLKKSVGATDEEIRKFIQAQVELLGEQTIEIGKQHVKLKDISQYILENTQNLGEQKEKVIEIAHSFQTLANQAKIVAEERKEEVDILSRISSILPILEKVSDVFEEISDDVREVVSGLRNILQVVKGLEEKNLGVVVEGFLGILVSVVKGMEVYFRTVENANVEWEKTQSLLVSINEMVDVLARYSELLPKAGNEYSKVLDEQRQLLIQQFKLIAQQLGLQNDFQNVNIEAVKQTLQALQNQRSMIEGWKAMIDREIKPLASTGLFGINIITREAWEKFQGIVNEMEKMGWISKEIASRWRDNAGITDDINHMVEILNSKLSETGAKIENVTRYMEIAQKLRSTDLDFQVQSNEFLAKMYENEERIAELRGEDMRKWKQKQIEALQKLKEAYQRQNDILNAQAMEIRILEQQKEMQEELNSLLDKRLQKMKELVGLGILDVENVADVQKMISELQKMGIAGIELYTRLSDMGVRAGGLTTYISQNWNVNLTNVTRDLFESFVQGGLK